ncbi:hypothetical protein MAP00_006634 [Monascus purpureus]|nr:hypothetical protein MAP00_006634 [Monascus purpureus]
MDHSTTVHENAVAPSPVVPTSRPGLSRKKRGMTPILASKQDNTTAICTGEAQLPERLSANSIEDQASVKLLRHSRSRNMLSQALPSVGALEAFKASHRRLWQVVQRQKKDSHGTKTVSMSPQPKSTRQASQDDSDHDSIQRKSAHNIKDIDQLWFEHTVKEKEYQDSNSNRIASLDFGDFGDFVTTMLTPLSGDSPSSQPAALSGDEKTALLPCVGEQPPDKEGIVGFVSIHDEGSNINGGSSATALTSEDADHSSSVQDSLLEGDNVRTLASPLRSIDAGQGGEQEQVNIVKKPGTVISSRSSTLGLTTTIQASPISIEGHTNIFPNSGIPSPSSFPRKAALSPLNKARQAPGVVIPPFSLEGFSSTNTELISESKRYSTGTLSLSAVCKIPSPPRPISSSPKQLERLGEKVSTHGVHQSYPKNKNIPSLASSSFGSIPTFPLPPPMKPLPQLPGFSLAGEINQGPSVSYRKLTPRGSTDSSCTQRSLGPSQPDVLRGSGSTNLRTLRTESTAPLRTTSESTVTSAIPANVSGLESSDKYLTERKCGGYTGPAHSVPLKDTAKTRPVNNHASPALAEWLIFPPSQFPRSRVTRPVRQHSARRTAEISKKAMRDAANSTSLPSRSSLPSTLPVMPDCAVTAGAVRVGAQHTVDVCKGTVPKMPKPGRFYRNNVIPSGTEIQATEVRPRFYMSSDRLQKRRQVQIPLEIDCNHGSRTEQATSNYLSPLSCQSHNSRNQRSSALQYHPSQRVTRSRNNSQKTQLARVLRELESRVAQLEQQNRILEAALFSRPSAAPNPEGKNQRCC